MGELEYKADRALVSDLEGPEYDAQELASKLVDIDERLNSSEYRAEDILFLNEVSEGSLEYEGLQEYSEDLLFRYNQIFTEPDLAKFEEYRNPLEYARSLAGDWKVLAKNSRYGDTGIEFFSEAPEDLENWTDEARVKAFEIMSTNIGREVVLNFMAYKPRGPFWDIAGAGYGFMRGVRMEIEERDIEERFREVFDLLEE